MSNPIETPDLITAKLGPLQVYQLSPFASRPLKIHLIKSWLIEEKIFSMEEPSAPLAMPWPEWKTSCDLPL
jgi:hypothetical protein